MKRAIINAKLYDVRRLKVQENKTIIWEDSVIKSVNDDVNLPNDVEVIDAKGCSVTPGLISSYTYLGLKEQGIGWEGNDSFEASGTNQVNLRAIDGIYPFDRAFNSARSEGITTAHVFPGPEHIIAGMTTIIKPYGNSIRHMAVQNVHGLAISLGEIPKRANIDKSNEPKTRMGIASLIREQFRKAKYRIHEDEYAYEILSKALSRKIPVYIQAHRSDDIATAIRLTKEFNLNTILVHATEAEPVIKLLEKAQIPILAGPFYTLKLNYEKKNVHPSTITYLNDINVPLGLINPLAKALTIEGALAIREGISAMDALYFLTLGSANILGLADKIGSIEPNKQADIVIWNGPPLELTSSINKTIINGHTVYKQEDDSL